MTHAALRAAVSIDLIATGSWPYVYRGAALRSSIAARETFRAHLPAASPKPEPVGAADSAMVPPISSEIVAVRGESPLGESNRMPGSPARTFGAEDLAHPADAIVATNMTATSRTTLQ
jgi:hypothetical protein